jgi:hypothetical protein
MLPPGMIHSVYTSEDRICVRGHFLTTGMMDRVIRVLQMLEVSSRFTDDCIPVDIFKVIIGFTEKVLRCYTYQIPPNQLARYVDALESYYRDNNSIPGCPNHQRRKDEFIVTLRTENLLQRLGCLVRGQRDPNDLSHVRGQKRRQGCGDAGLPKRMRESYSKVTINLVDEGLPSHGLTEGSEQGRRLRQLSKQGPTATPRVLTSEGYVVLFPSMP